MNDDARTLQMAVQREGQGGFPPFPEESHKKYRVLHFVSGGGSGSTGMAVSLAVGHQHGSRFEPLVVFRRKKENNPALEQILQTEKINFQKVCTAPKIKTLWQLCKIIRKFHPHVFIAHGFSEHIWGRIAAWMTHVPVIIQVEHNRERYSGLRLWQSKLLLNVTHTIVCVSEGVKRYLQNLRFNTPKMTVIHNGIFIEELKAFCTPYAHRADNIIMVARFSRQKDHATLIHAAKILQAQHYSGQVFLVGKGKKRYEEKNKRLCQQLHLADTVQFLNQKTKIEIQKMLGENKIFVLSTRYEGMPLALIEAMAAGCVVIASDVEGVSELIEHGKTGFRVPPEDPRALSQTIKEVLDHPQMASRIAQAGQENVTQYFNVAKMVSCYEQLCLNALQE